MSIAEVTATRDGVLGGFASWFRVGVRLRVRVRVRVRVRSFASWSCLLSMGTGR